MAATANGAAQTTPNDEIAFWGAHATELVVRYPDQYVAVYEGRVVAAGANLLAVISALQQQGLEPVQVWLRYLNADLVNLIL